MVLNSSRQSGPKEATANPASSGRELAGPRDRESSACRAVGESWQARGTVNQAPVARAWWVQTEDRTSACCVLEGRIGKICSQVASRCRCLTFPRCSQFSSLSFAFLAVCVRFRGAAGGSWTAPQDAKCYPNKLSKEKSPSSPPACLLPPPCLSSSLPSPPLPSFLPLPSPPLLSLPPSSPPSFLLTALPFFPSSFHELSWSPYPHQIQSKSWKERDE